MLRNALLAAGIVVALLTATASFLYVRNATGAGNTTGTIVVLDASSKAVLAWIGGSRDIGDYAAAIDAALAVARR